MKFTNRHKNVELIIAEELLVGLERYGLAQYPNEFGGFLLGYYSEDFTQLYVIDAILPKKYKGIPSLFERSIEGMEEIFRDLFERKKLQYVGEWHSHIDGTSMYSQTDLQAMTEIANHDTVYIENPILLIMSIGEKGRKDFSIYLYDNSNLYKYE
ncbi:MAG: Mov34/MPN/PAD-1 family protein [Spirochaetota bacterium]